MTVMQSGGLLIIGLSLMTVGIVKKKKWLIVSSIILLLIVVCQVILLLGMAAH